MRPLILTVAVAVALVACTDTQRARMGSYGEEGHIVCKSGGQPLIDDWSTGRILKESSGADGFAWKSAEAHPGLLVESNGDCVVVHGEVRS